MAFRLYGKEAHLENVLRADLQHTALGYTFVGVFKIKSRKPIKFDPKQRPQRGRRR